MAVDAKELEAVLRAYFKSVLPPQHGSTVTEDVSEKHIRETAAVSR